MVLKKYPTGGTKMVSQLEPLFWLVKMSGVYVVPEIFVPTANSFHEGVCVISATRTLEIPDISLTNCAEENIEQKINIVVINSDFCILYFIKQIS
jgi:hypothetical protein